MVAYPYLAEYGNELVKAYSMRNSSSYAITSLFFLLYLYDKIASNSNHPFISMIFYILGLRVLPSGLPFSCCIQIE